MSLFLAVSGSVSAGQAALCVMLSMSMVTSLAKLEVFSNSIKEVQMTVEELQAYLELEELPEPQGAAEEEVKSSAFSQASVAAYGIELKNVRFSYGKGKEEVLHGINLKLPPGSFTALAGPFGGGKSTVARLIARFWDPDSGEILLGGKSLKEYSLSELSGMVSFVTQDNFLFRCSLKENIRIGNPAASDEEVFAAAKAAQCDEFIRKTPKGISL